jgi:hypothetical protein
MKNTTLQAMLASLLLALPIAAIADRDDAETALARASGGIAAAERAGAPQLSPNEASVARERLMQAERSCERRDWDDCERAAHRAYADARLAEARSRQAKAESATAALQSAVDTLRVELDRTGASR